VTFDSPAETMEQSLVAIADAGVDIAPLQFERFFRAFPDQRSTFTNLEAAQGRMTMETVEALIGLATQESWVPVTITNFVDLHRNYGPIPLEQYFAFVDMIVLTLAQAAGPSWTKEQEQVWTAQAKKLNGMIAEAFEGRTPAMCE